MMPAVLLVETPEMMASRRGLSLLTVLARAAAVGSWSAWSLVVALVLQMGCWIDAAEAEPSAAVA